MSLLPLARFSCSPRKASDTATLEARPLWRSPIITNVFEPPPAIPNPEDYQRRPLPERSRKLFSQLGICSPLERGVLQSMNLPNHFKAKKSFYGRYTHRHVIYMYDLRCYASPYVEHAGAPVKTAYYEKKKKEEPFWHWEYGTHANGKNCLVIGSNITLQRALRKSLEERGFDYFGRRLSRVPSGEGEAVTDDGDDLRGTLIFYATDPSKLCFKHDLTRQEVQEAVDYMLDQFIHLSRGGRGKAEPFEKPTKQPRKPVDVKLKPLLKKPWTLVPKPDTDTTSLSQTDKPTPDADKTPLARQEKKDVDTTEGKQLQTEAQKSHVAAEKPSHTKQETTDRSRKAWALLESQYSSSRLTSSRRRR